MSSAIGATEVSLQAPLTTVISGWTRSDTGPDVLRARVIIAANAPRDLGVGVCVSDAHGRWYQRVLGSIGPGTHLITCPITAEQPFISEGHGGAWNALAQARCDRGGLFFWSTTPADAVITVQWLTPDSPSTPSDPTANTPLQLMDIQPSAATAHTGQRCEITFRLRHESASPYDAIPLHLVVQDPQGHTQSLRSFYRQPMARQDRGDVERVVPIAPAERCIRWRPRMPGQYQLTLVFADSSNKNSSSTRSVALPTVTVSGEPWDDYIHVDATDPRFFAKNDSWFWPMGPNLRSVWDLRGKERLGSELTPDRGSFAYDAYLQRAAAGGANACEIWLSAWNLALEWNAQWDGYYGLNGYNEANAWKLDAVLDRCEALGICVNLVVNNHGQGSNNTDREWPTSPWNRANGGPLSEPGQIFTDPRPLAGQRRLREYLCARYADSPAILGWKLWSEMNLTAGSRSDLRAWHAEASAHFAAADPYHHPVTTHWSGDYRTVDQDLAAIPTINYICIDAYHGMRNENGTPLHDLFQQSLHNPYRGLSKLGKPVIVTEFGGNWSAGPEALIDAEHRAGPWLALVNGFAGSPMLWWFEWIDQTGRWGAYQPVANFLVDEDLRGADAKAIALTTSAPNGLWAGCWSRSGRRLGYILDDEWGATGNSNREWRNITIEHGAAVPGGPISISWWDPDRGIEVQRIDWEHQGGPLAVTVPPFRHHVAFKLWRQKGEVAD